MRLRQNITVLLIVTILAACAPHTHAEAEPQGLIPVATQFVLKNGDIARCPQGGFETASADSVQCIINTATPTKTPTKTATTAPPSATAPATGTPAAGLQAWQVWHPAGKHLLVDGTMSNFHEHGLKEWVWVDAYNMFFFGIPSLMFGGDEISSPMEQLHKHQAYENITFTFINNGCEVQYNLRFHASSTPADRSSKTHSFEIYVMDCKGLAAWNRYLSTGNTVDMVEAFKHVTFNQGLYWSGDPANRAQRMCHGDQFGGTIAYDGTPSVIRDQYVIISRCENEKFPTSDTWYVHFPVWDFGITLLDSTTYFHYGEHLNDPMNPATWVLAKDSKGNQINEKDVRLEITMLPNPNVSVPFIVPKDSWWCIEKFPTISTRNFNGRTLPYPYWKFTGKVANQNSCPAGYLPQYNASSTPAIYGGTPSSQGGNDIERINLPWNPLITVPQ